MWGKNTSVVRLSSWIEKAGQAVWWYQMVPSAEESEAEKNRDGDADCELENTQGWSGETFRWANSGGLGLCIGDRKLKLVRNSKTQVGANLPVWWSTIWQRITALTWLLSTEPPDGQWFAGVGESEAKRAAPPKDRCSEVAVQNHLERKKGRNPKKPVLDAHHH